MKTLYLKINSYFKGRATGLFYCSIKKASYRSGFGPELFVFGVGIRTTLDNRQSYSFSETVFAQLWIIDRVVRFRSRYSHNFGYSTELFVFGVGIRTTLDNRQSYSFSKTVFAQLWIIDRVIRFRSRYSHNFG